VEGAVLDRKITDKLLMDKARSCGAEVVDKTTVVDIVKSNNKYILKTNQNRDIEANMIIIANGVNFKFADKLGIKTIQRRDLLPMGIQYQFQNAKVKDHKYFHFILDQNYAPGWKISVNPISPSKVDIAIFAMGSKPNEYAAKVLKEHPYIKEMVKGATMVQKWAGKDVIYAKPKRTYTNKVIFTGSAAGLGGLAFGYKIGEMAGEVAAKCVSENDYSEQNLKLYEKMWRAKYKDLFTWGVDLARALTKIKNSQIEEFVDSFQDDRFRDIVVGEKYRELIRTMFKYLLKKNPSYSMKFMLSHPLLSMKLAPVFIPWIKYKNRI
jgi:digeranylgeranylglycerophospholipid reductase